jgi:hypothetical protein
MQNNQEKWHPPAIFECFHRNPPNPREFATGSRQELFAELGLQSVSPESSSHRHLQEQIEKDFFSEISTRVRFENGKARIDIHDTEYQGIARPFQNFFMNAENLAQILFQFDDDQAPLFITDTKLIRKDRNSSHFMLPFMQFGWRIKAIPYKINNSTYIDLLSLLPPSNRDVLFSVSAPEISSGRQKENVTIGGGVYQPELITLKPRIKNEDFPRWDVHSFVFDVLHEFGHSETHSYGSRYKSVIWKEEREANTWVLETVRSLGKKYGSSASLLTNYQVARDYVEKQLKGYSWTLEPDKIDDSAQVDLSDINFFF